MKSFVMTRSQPSWPRTSQRSEPSWWREAYDLKSVTNQIEAAEGDVT
jgi:hypothetical protein